MRCEDCVEQARLRNRDMDGMLLKAKQQAIDESKPKAVCWSGKKGLYIEDAITAISGKATIRHIVSQY